MNVIKYLKEVPLSKKILCLIFVVFGCIFYTTVIANHYYFRTSANDYAVFNFAFWDYAHLHSSPVPCFYIFSNNEPTLLQNHFSFILIYFVPLYWLLNWLTGSYTLLIIQTTIILWSGWAIYRLIKLKANDNWLAVISVLFYFLLEGRYASFGADFNICIVMWCFIPPFIFYFEQKKYRTSFIFLILILFSREDMPLYLIFIFVTLIFWHWKERKIINYCLLGIVISAGCFILIFKVLIPMIETPQTKYILFQYAALGKTPGEAVLHIFRHPIDTFKLLYENPLPDHTFDRVKIEFYLTYLISGGFLLFIRPKYFIWFIPIVAQKVFNDDPVRWGILTYYAIPVVTLFPISLFMIISVFKTKWVRYLLASSICILALSVTCYKIIGNNLEIPWDSTEKDNVFRSGFFDPGYEMKKIYGALDQIPANAVVSGSESVLSHLAQRKYAYVFPEVKDADYIALFTFTDYPIRASFYSDMVFNYICNPSWDIITYAPPFVLLKKNIHASHNFVRDSIACGAEFITSDKSHLLASNGEVLSNMGTRDSLVRHSGKYSICVNKHMQYGFVYQPMNLKTGDLLKISVWKYPAYRDTGSFVVSCGGDYYKSISLGSEKDSTGWTRITMYISVPENHTDFKIYTWNGEKANVWFDDMKIVKYTLK